MELRKLITELTEKMTELFSKNFNLVNKHFGIIFKEFFGAEGIAELSLTDDNNSLESGIEIMAQPPGKKILHLSSLAGGEKALIAISIYFAILKVRPSPFCLLDEVDAALDAVNVDRFAAYLRTLTDSTQIIALTHRPGTMEGSDTIYGVTMEERGVSKVLMMDVNEVSEKLGIKE
jgi:chromosome segregation protein